MKFLRYSGSYEEFYLLGYNSMQSVTSIIRVEARNHQEAGSNQSLLISCLAYFLP
jgi:hypothetical protein